MSNTKACSALALMLILSGATNLAPGQYRPEHKNKPENVESFRDDGLGLFIHWGVDGSLAGGISHELVGASADFQKRFFDELPGFFDPKHFDPDGMASLAKLSGFKYVVFTTKHHSGFCMWDTKTTDFNVTHTPYRKDLLRELVQAFRKQHIKIGLYYSPDDFHWLYQHHIPIRREVKGVYPQDIPAFMDYTKAQMRELLTQYGPIDYMFFDGPAEHLKEYAWHLQPNMVVTRGEIETPEQYTPGVALPGPWEGNLTMGTEWPWKATNETYKSGTELIDTIIETRAKGGNLLLNIGPRPDGTVAIEQESRLREIAMWNFVNQEAITGTRPWVITNERNIWLTRAKDSNTVYAFLTDMSPWRLGGERTFTLRSVHTRPQTQISVLGQDDTVVEYQPDVDPKTRWTEDSAGLHVRVVRAQRLYTNRLWPNPVVVKMTNVTAGITPPEVKTAAMAWDAEHHAAILNGALVALGKVPTVEVGFQYRMKKGGVDLSEKTEPWTDLPLRSMEAPGPLQYPLAGLAAGKEYEFRARVHHPLLDTYGVEVLFRVPAAETRP